MLLKIDREVCIAQYRNFPLCPYDQNTDEEVYYFPKIITGGWYEIPSIPRQNFMKRLSFEITRLVIACKIERLIFLSDKDGRWVTKLSSNRTDYPPLIKAVAFFEKNKLGKNFNGGIEVAVEGLAEFLQHYYCVTRCDGSFHSGYFSNPAQSFIGGIHYSGEVQICVLKKKFLPVMEKALRQTKFKRNSR